MRTGPDSETDEPYRTFYPITSSFLSFSGKSAGVIATEEERDAGLLVLSGRKLTSNPPAPCFYRYQDRSWSFVVE
ncbi:hypothetical protein D5086_005098 [Populus alba]|uniref:Uncharacterized protein n=1 Tax=Populus alba TaxID=43335 RepID=A0ACC4CSA8_POPAL